MERKIGKNDLMICNDDVPMCIAGVYGGTNFGVTENTKSIFLESAYFDPVSVRKPQSYIQLTVMLPLGLKEVLT